MAGKRPVCKYGSQCYRKNSDHLKQYYHPPDDEEREHKQASLTVTKELVSVAQKSSDVVGRKPSSDDSDNIDPKMIIKEKFLVEMPQDFYDFWEFCKSLNPNSPADALQESVGLTLVGPYLVLAGQLRTSGWEDCVVQSRYFYDTPEILTVLESSKKSGYHIGYFRDDPDELPVFLVSNHVKESCVLKVEADNLFAVVRLQIAKKLSLSKQDVKLQELNDKLLARSGTLGYEVGESKNSKRRNKKVVARCFNKIGMVVPVANDIGYRPLPMSNGELRKTLDKIVSSTTDAQKGTAFEPLEEMVSFVQFANDECDYGMGLELGIDLFCHGDQFHSIATNMLPLAYELLHRPAFGRIVKQHLISRKKD